jgi:glycine oxidase
MPTTSADVIVVGAGVVGLAAARALAGGGAGVLVVERRRVGAEASTAAAGMLAPQAAEPGSPLMRLGLRARDRHLDLAPALEEETGIALDLSRLGRLDLAFDAAGERELDERERAHRALGLPVEALTGADVRESEPNVSPAVRKGLFFAGDRRVDNVRLTRALAASAVARGATLVTGRPVTGLLVESGRVAGVRAGAETLRAPVVINAAGAWAGLLAGDPQPPPVEPVRGQIVAFEVAPALLRHVVCSPRGYLVPRSDGRVLAGSTSEKAGYDKAVTAAGMRAVLDLALELAPALADVRVADAWAGLRPGTADGLPVIGAGALPGLIHAGGLYRDGILLGPLVGELAAGMARGAPSDPDLAPFAPARFGAPPAAAAV